MYSIVSGVLTFWLPAVVMVYVYIRYLAVIFPAPIGAQELVLFLSVTKPS